MSNLAVVAPCEPRNGGRPVPSNPLVPLTPTQAATLERLHAALARRTVVVFECPDGFGRTRVLEALHARVGGALLRAGDLVESIAERHPLAIEHALDVAIGGALARASPVIVDDAHLAMSPLVDSCSPYPRRHLVDAVFASWLRRVEQGAGPLVLGVRDCPRSLRGAGARVWMPAFGPRDYERLFAAHLPDARVATLDLEEVHRQFRSLCPRTIARAAAALSEGDGATVALLAWLQKHVGGNNVHREEVEAVTFADLRGADDVVRGLEMHVVRPIQSGDLARRLRLRPKRGVLLYGPPGTGKTTVGRALAHRLESKFFLLDGRMVAGSGSFYCELDSLIRAARRQRPSVVFVDDADVLFDDEKDPGLYRYFLSLLDGLEGEGVRDVCVVLAAMQVRRLPPALLRAGRVELWLEMKLPDEAVRREIVERRLASEWPEELERPDATAIAAASRGFTGADLRRLVGDVKNAVAEALSEGREVGPIAALFEDALAVIRKNRRMTRPPRALRQRRDDGGA